MNNKSLMALQLDRAAPAQMPLRTAYWLIGLAFVLGVNAAAWCLVVLMALHHP